MPPESQSLEQLYSAHSAGDREASRQLVERLTPLLADTARQLGAPRDARDDLVQETWLAVLADNARPDASQPLLPWMKAVLRHRLLRAARRTRRCAENRVEFDELELAAPAPASSPDRSELERIVHAALQKLPLDYRAPLALHLLDGLTPLEVARRLALPRSSVRVLLHRGRVRLARSLPRGVVSWMLLLRLRLGRLDPSRWRQTGALAAVGAVTLVLALSWLSARSSPGADSEVVGLARLGEPARAGVDEQLEEGSFTRAPVPPAQPSERSDELLVHVRDPLGRAAPGVAVWLEPLNGRDPRTASQVIATDAHGVARFTARPLGKLRLGADGGDSRTIDGDVSSLELGVAAGVELRARVVDADGSAVRAASVWLGDIAGSRRGTIVARTDADGRFRLAHAPPTARFAVLADGFARTPMLALPARADEEALVVLERGAARVSVIVRDSDGAPLSDALVIAGRSVDGLPAQLSAGVLPDFPPPLQLRTDASGRVDFDTLEPGEHALVVRAPGFMAHAGALSAAPHAPWLEEVSLRRATIVRGCVVDPAGQPLAGAQVAWSNENELHSTHVTTTDRGEFVIDTATAGRSALAARAMDHGAIERELTLNEAVDADVVLALPPLPRCTGRLLDSAGAPLAGHSLRLMGAPATSFAPNSDETVTSESGEFTLAVPGGQIRAIELRVAGSPQWLPVRRAWLREREGRLDVVVPTDARPACVLRGRVLTSSRRPLERRTLALVERAGPRAGLVIEDAARTDERGEFEIGPLLAGEYQLVVVRSELDASDAPMGALAPITLSHADNERVEWVTPPPAEVVWELRRSDGALAQAPVLALALPDALLDVALARGARGSLHVFDGVYTLRAMGEDFAPVPAARIELAGAPRVEWAPSIERADPVRLVIAELPGDIDESAGLRVVRAADERELARFELAPSEVRRPTFAAFLPPGDYSARVRRRVGGVAEAAFSATGAGVIELRWIR